MLSFTPATSVAAEETYNRSRRGVVAEAGRPERSARVMVASEQRGS